MQAEFDRRTFLGHGAALGVLGLAAPSLLARGVMAADTSKREVPTASHWGAIEAKVEGGRRVSITPREKDPAPSRRLPGILDSVWSPSRIE